MKRKRMVLAAPLLLLALLAAGCRDAYTESMSGSAKVSTAVEQGIAVVRDLHTNGTITQTERNQWLLYFQDVTTVNTDFRTRVRAIKAQGATGNLAYLDVANAALASLTSVEGKHVLKVGSSASQAKLDLTMHLIHSVMNTLALALQKGGN